MLKESNGIPPNGIPQLSHSARRTFVSDKLIAQWYWTQHHRILPFETHYSGPGFKMTNVRLDRAYEAGTFF